MKPKSNKYWENRFVELKKNQLNKAETLAEELEKQYKITQTEIQKDIDHWYNRIAKNNQISMQEARKLLSDDELDEFKWSVDEYIKYGQENSTNQRWMKELENASAKYHISRLEAIKIRMKNHISKNFDNEEKSLKATLEDIYTDTYLTTGYEYQNALGVYYDFAGIDEKLIETVINKPWASDGSNFSKRIWGDHRAALVEMLEKDFTECIKRGDNPTKIAKKIADNMGVATDAAKTLVRTEAAYFASAAELEAYKEDGTTEYKISSALESDRTCERCKSRHGKHYSVDKYVIGSTAPPFHPRCRCTTAPYFDDDFTKYNHRDEEFKELSFKEWKNKFVKSDKRFTKEGESGIIKENDIQIMKSVGAKAYQDEVKLLNGQRGRIAEGSRITKVYTFAGKGTNKPVKVAKYLSQTYNNVPESEWKKVRGDGYVEYPDGSIKHVELHWFESKQTGRIKMKVKREFKDDKS